MLINVTTNTPASPNNGKANSYNLMYRKNRQLST